MSLAEDIRDYFVRHFLGRVQIHGHNTASYVPESDENSSDLGLVFRLPTVMTLRREVETHPIRTQMQIRSPELLSFGKNSKNGGLKCSNGGFRFEKALVKIRGERVRRYVKKEIVVAHVPLMRTRAKPKSGLKYALLMPQERPSRLRWQKARPTLVPGETVLAWYGPLIEGAVLKMTLNRQRGTLLVWYDPRSRHFKPSGLYLCRRFGVGTKPEWRWV